MPELTDLPALDAAAARDWIDRWDRQQEVYMPDREDRFTALIDAVEAGTGRPDPLVLDLGCGPGSLAVRLLRAAARGDRRGGRRGPGHALARPRRLRVGAPGCASSTWTCATTGWASRLGLGRPAGGRGGVHDRAALALGGGTARAVRDAGRPAAAGRAVPRRRPPARRRDGQPGAGAAGAGAGGAGGRAALPGRARRPARRTGTSGGRRWRQTRRWPRPAAERSQGLVHHSNEGAQLAAHTSALRAAGFAEVGTLWQRGSSRVLCGVR